MLRSPAIVVALLLAGCAETDPYQRTGMWQPVGANTLNLAAMVVNPNDLLRGRGTTATPGIEAVPPVLRYWANRPTVLPTTSSQAASAGQGRPTTGGGSGGSGGGEAN